MISVEEALDHVCRNTQPLPIKSVALQDLPGHILTQPILADVDSPPHDKSVMDGFAIRAEDASGESQDFELLETVVAGSLPRQTLQPGQATEIMTGAPLPNGADAVVMVEQSQHLESNSSRPRVRLQGPVSPEQNVLRQGANFSQGQTLYPAGHRVRPIDVGLLAEVGVASAMVSAKPKIAILPTGDELVDFHQQPGAGQIRNSNGPMLTAMATALGLASTQLPIACDDQNVLRDLIQQGLQTDLLVLSGGVSAGQKDLVPEMLTQAGVQPIFHKVLVKPGKPIWFGVRPASDGHAQCIVFGLPGNPVSSLVGFQLFVTTAILRLLGAGQCRPQSCSAVLDQPHQTRGNRPTYWPGQRVETSDGVLRVAAVDWKGSSDLGSLAKADGLIRFAVDHHDHPVGEQVEYFPF